MQSVDTMQVLISSPPHDEPLDEVRVQGMYVTYYVKKAQASQCWVHYCACISVYVNAYWEILCICSAMVVNANYIQCTCIKNTFILHVISTLASLWVIDKCAYEFVHRCSFSSRW